LRRCNNVFEVIAAMQENKVDLIFLDIEMPGMDGIQFIKTLTGVNRPSIIFVSAYNQFAIEGYELDVLDYLLKPVAIERFLKALNKALEVIESRRDHKKSTQNEFIFVQSEYNLIKVNLPEISHIEGLKDYIKIHLINVTHPIITRMTMKTMEEQLPSEFFLRIHRSFIVNLQKIISIRKGRIKLTQTEIPVGENYNEALFQKIGNKNL
jgi:DNA-binding LytR/AlgR family response regulator